MKIMTMTRVKTKKDLISKRPINKIIMVFFVLASLSHPFVVLSESKTFQESTGLSYSFFGETGETETVFKIGGRNFPVKVGSVGLKASVNPNQNVELYTRAGIGYSPKQSISAFNFDVSGSVFATSIGAGGSAKYRVRNSNFVIVPFADYNLYNYSSDTFRGTKDENLLKANVRGKSSFLRGGIELRYLTQDGFFFFGTGANKWDVENRVTIVEGNLSITPRVWADNTDTFFQLGALFETGSGKATIGARMSDLTHEINTQLVEFFAQVQVDFD